ncbi:MAG: methyltransferase domain-containing protein [Gemmatimonadales bacterium]
MTGPQRSRNPFRELQFARFRVSVLKQAKWRELSRAAGDTSGKCALDVGSDNGVIGLLFREKGGEWTSADRSDEAVDAIRQTLGEPVTQLRDATLPFPNASFDLIVIADLLEHVADDRAMLAEVARCLRVGGRAILNVPQLNRWGMLLPLRRALGLTDEWHGHVHAGYDERSLRALLPATLRLTGTRDYVRFFSYALDTALNAGARRAGTGDANNVRPVSGAQRAMYPAMRAFAALDALIPFARGYMLVATLERTAGATDAYAASSLRRNASRE